MSYITLGPNEIVYIKGVGYGTLVHCGSRNTIAQKVDAPVEKRESIYFDPDLFNSDGESNKSKKSQKKVQEEKVEKKLVEVIALKNFQEQNAKQKTEKNQQKAPQAEPKKVQQQNVNIVKAKLQGSQVMVYTSQKNISKSIIVVVKSFLINRKEQVIVDIEINKTVDTLRKMVFQQLGQQMNNYYNIKLYTTLPMMTELSVHSKTMINYQIKDTAKLILTADYAFSFRPLPANLQSKYKIGLNNNITLTSTKIVEELKKADSKTPIALPPPSEVHQSNQKKEQSTENKQQTPKKEENKQQKTQQNLIKKQSGTQKQDAVTQLGPFNAKCSIDFDNGRRYWQIKIQKLPSDEDDLLIGVCVQSQEKQLAQCWNCDYLWAYQVISGKKVWYERDREQNVLDEESQNYGYTLRQNDVIGVLLTIRGKKACLHFYKNAISCGQAFSIDLDSLKSQNKKLTPFVNIGGQAQVTLDSKAPPPLDSYRLK